MREVSLLRLYILRATYLFIAIGLGAMIGPGLLGTPAAVEHFRGVTWCLLAAVGILSLFGIRYPLQLIPILLFELAWKAIWLLSIGLPLRSGGRLEGAFLETWSANVVGIVIVALAIPWGYVIRRYLREPGDRWSGLRRENIGGAVGQA